MIILERLPTLYEPGESIANKIPTSARHYSQGKLSGKAMPPLFWLNKRQQRQNKKPG